MGLILEIIGTICLIVIALTIIGIFGGFVIGLIKVKIEENRKEKERKQKALIKNLIREVIQEEIDE